MENRLVYFRDTYSYITVHIDGGNPETIYERLENGDLKEIEIEGLESRIYGLPYGFSLPRTNGSTKETQISIIDLSHYDSSNVSNMHMMLGGYETVHYTCTQLKVIVGTLNTSQVTDMSSMFMGSIIIDPENILHFNTSQVTDMGSMFSDCSGLASLDISNFDTSKVTNMSYMFTNCSSLSSLDLGNFDTSQVTDMYRMFEGCTSLTHIKTNRQFYNWCIENKDEIYLPEQMANGTVGNTPSNNWELID